LHERNKQAQSENFKEILEALVSSSKADLVLSLLEALGSSLSITTKQDQ
jgi:hypothetical protein